MTTDLILPDSRTIDDLRRENIHLCRQLEDAVCAAGRLRAENTCLKHTSSALSAEVGQLRMEVSCLRAEREKMRSRMFNFAWEMARGEK